MIGEPVLNVGLFSVKTERTILIFRELAMPEKKTIERAKRDKAEGKAATTQAGEFVREEIEHIREGKHGARSPQQAIAIGLSKARRAGVDLPPPRKGTTSEATRKRAERDLEKGRSGKQSKPSARRSRARREVLKREPPSAASKTALSKQAKQAAARRRVRGKTTASRKSIG
jgi:Family of unknown function (DUF6496)